MRGAGHSYFLSICARLLHYWLTGISVEIHCREASVEGQRTGGMSVIATLNIIVGGLEILAGLFQLLGTVILMYELLQVGAFDIPVGRLAFSLLVLATGIVGMIAGIGLFLMRPWARNLSFAFAGLLIVSALFSFIRIPLIRLVGTYDFASIGAFDMVRLIIFSAAYVVVPVLYAPILFAALCSPAWRRAFAGRSESSPLPLIRR